jgi:hypothetical protein
MIILRVASLCELASPMLEPSGSSRSNLIVSPPPRREPPTCFHDLTRYLDRGCYGLRGRRACGQDRRGRQDVSRDSLAHTAGEPPPKNLEAVHCAFRFSLGGRPASRSA